MNIFWKLLLVGSLAAHLVTWGAQIVIVDWNLRESAAQTGALMGVSKDQQVLRRQVVALEQEMDSSARGKENQMEEKGTEGKP